jgi:tellurite resistance protein TerC
VTDQVLLWVVFSISILIMLALDLGVFHREAEVIGMREALGWSVVWTVLALVFNAGIYAWQGSESALAFLTGYLIERFLSVDNIFVFLLIFSYFHVSPKYQHKVLFWGILGALVMRAIFIVAGVALIRNFYWVVYLFGVLLVGVGLKMALSPEKEVHPERNPLLKLARRFIPMTGSYAGSNFFVKLGGQYVATPLFVVLLVIAATDLVFAIDSIPAVLAVTTDPFIIWTSNVFAVLGMRALYFAAERVMQMFHYLTYGLAAVLVFVGIKMLVSHWLEIPVEIALAVVLIILGISVAASVLRPPREDDRTDTQQ